MIQSHYINAPPHFKTNINFQRQNILWTKAYDEKGENNNNNNNKTKKSVKWHKKRITKETYFALFPPPKCLLKPNL